MGNLELAVFLTNVVVPILNAAKCAAGDFRFTVLADDLQNNTQKCFAFSSFQ